jgi:hypothetical protein
MAANAPSEFAEPTSVIFFEKRENIPRLHK